MPKGIYARTPKPRRSLHERFWEKVEKTDTCWLWTGADAKRKNADYGHIWDYSKKRVIRAHQAVWILTYGPIPNRMQILHRCDTPLCVRPDHLFLGTQADNIADMDRKWRRRTLSGDDHPARRPGARVGSKNGRSRLTADDVRKIRHLRADGMLFKEIAARFDVAVPTIQHIVSGKNWSHIK